MSISDDLMWRYFELLSFRTLKEIQQYRDAVEEGKNPRDIKFKLAQEIVARFHDDDSATKAKTEFIARFQKGAIPDDVIEHDLKSDNGEMGIAYLLKHVEIVVSTSEAFRMIQQGAVKIDGEKISDKNLKIKSGTTHIYQVGKRKFAKVNLL